MSPKDERSAGSTGLGVAEKEDATPAADSHNITDTIRTFLILLCQWFGGIAIGFINQLGLVAGRIVTVCKHGLDRLAGYARRSVRRFAVQNDIPVGEMKANMNALIAGSQAAAREGIGRFAGYWLTRFAGLLLRGVKTLFTNKDYFLPAAASAAFVAVVVTITQLNFGLSVTYNGEFIGYIADESIFNRAETQVQGRIVYTAAMDEAELDHAPEFEVVIIKSEELTTVNELTNRLILASGNEITEAYGLYVDDSFQGAVSDQTLVLGLLDALLNAHRTGDPTEEVGFVQNVEVRDGLYPVRSVVTIDDLEENATRLVAQQRIYTVQRGDAPTLIAQRNNVPYAELKKLNPEIETKLLIGQEVILSQSVPFIGVKLAKEEVYEEAIAFNIERTVDPNREQGSIQVTQTGQSGTKEIKAKVSYVDGLEQDRVILDTRTTKEPVTEKVIVGGKVPETQVITTTSSASGKFIWPVEGGGRVTCGFYGYYGHTGMDIALRSGATIRAAAAGTVSLVRYSSVGYGNHIMIDHGGGVQTLYGHNSAIYVTQGQWVEQGQSIAAMGRTGRATGVHVHFEIRIGGSYKNPASYIGNTPW